MWGKDPGQSSLIEVIVSRPTTTHCIFDSLISCDCECCAVKFSGFYCWWFYIYCPRWCFGWNEQRHNSFEEHSDTISVVANGNGCSPLYITCRMIEIIVFSSWGMYNVKKYELFLLLSQLVYKNTHLDKMLRSIYVVHLNRNDIDLSPIYCGLKMWWDKGKHATRYTILEHSQCTRR